MPFWRWCLCAFVVCSLSFVGTAPLESQGPDVLASLTGEVTDPSGARIPHASIHIHSDKLDRDASANGTGDFAVNVRAGNYTVTVRAPGFRPLSRRTTLADGDHRTLNFRLSIDAVEESISVGPSVGT